MNSDRRTRLIPIFNRYAAECQERAGSLLSVLSVENPDLQTVILQAHTLAGSGATMGAELLSVNARRLEVLAKAIQEEGRQASADEWRSMAALAQSLADLVQGFQVDTMLDGFIAKMFPAG